MKIELGHLPDPDLNPNKRLHYMAVSRAKREARELIGWLSFEQGIPPVPIRKAHITVTFVSRDKRRRDVDNLFASMKPYIDGLVAVGVLLDDSATNVRYTIQYEHGSSNNTIIEVNAEIQRNP